MEVHVLINIDMLCTKPKTWTALFSATSVGTMLPDSWKCMGPPHTLILTQKIINRQVPLENFTGYIEPLIIHDEEQLVMTVK